MRDFYTTDKGGNYIGDIDEATNSPYMKLKTVTNFVELRVLNIRLRSSVIKRIELKMKLRLQKYSSILARLIVMQYMKMMTSSLG